VKSSGPFIREFWSRAPIGTRWLTKDREPTATCGSRTAWGFNANRTTTAPRARNYAGRGTTCSAIGNATATAIRPVCRDGLGPAAIQVGSFSNFFSFFPFIPWKDCISVLFFLLATKWESLEQRLRSQSRLSPLIFFQGKPENQKTTEIAKKLTDLFFM
jgi:hypothetical protein